MSVPYKIIPKQFDAQMKTNKNIKWNEFITSNFELRDESFVSKNLVIKLFKEQYPDFGCCSFRQITKAISKLEISYDEKIFFDKARRNKADGIRGIFIGLYSIYEQDNCKLARDLEYEAHVMNSDDCIT